MRASPDVTPIFLKKGAESLISPSLIKVYEVTKYTRKQVRKG